MIAKKATSQDIMAFMQFLQFLMTVTVVSCTSANKSNQDYVIYVDPMNGTTDINCWTSGLEQPCQNLEIALEGAKQIKDSAIILLHPISIQPSKPLNDVEKVNNTDNCLTWMNFNATSDRCECGTSINGVVRCNDTLQEVSILDCYLMTFDDELDQVIVGRSFYGCNPGPADREDLVYYKVPNNKTQINDIMCNHNHFNRKGRLCGKCKENYHPLVYSYNLSCIQCSEVESRKNWFKAAAVAFIPLTLLYAFAMLLNFNANSPSLHGFVLLAQLLSTPTGLRLAVSQQHCSPLIYRVAEGALITLFSIWSLDFFRILYPDICLRVTTLQVLFLEYLVAIYPPMLILLTYFASKLHSQGFRIVIWAWKPFQLCL